MVGKSSIFVGYFRGQIPPHAIYDRLKQLCPDLRHLEIRSKPIGLNEHVQFCCATFDTEADARAALHRLRNSVVRKQRLVVRMWQDRSNANERRKAGNGSPQEKRRRERRGPTRYTLPELERLLVMSTPGKWRPQARIWSALDRDPEAHDGFVEAMDPGSDARVKVCEVTRESDRRLISAAPELATQCLTLLDELESALLNSHDQARRFAELRQEKHEESELNKILLELYAESLGRRLLLITTEKDRKRFRNDSKGAFIEEIRELKRRLGR